MTITERSISRVSFAVRLIDGFSARPSLLGATRVFITQSGGSANPKPSGYHVFTDLTETNVTVRIENANYFPKEVAINIPALDSRNPVTAQTMKPNALYPFPAATTLVRGVILDSTQRPFRGAHVAVIGATVANESEADGRFVLYWGPLDEDHVSVVNHRRLLKIGNSTTIALHLTLSQKVLVGPRWLVPSVEGLLLVVLVVIAPARATARSLRVRRFALFVVGFVTLTTVISLVLLVHFLINGGKTGGHSLILSGIVLWATNVLIFAVWYWEMDRGGPVVRFEHPDAMPDFQFPQMENPKLAPAGWMPGFLDYFYTSLTNSTAFSPTDTMPLTQTAKILMGVQGVSALVTVGLVVARAVNILG